MPPIYRNIIPVAVFCPDGLACFRFSRRFSLLPKSEGIANEVYCCMVCSERDLKLVKVRGHSSGLLLVAGFRHPPAPTPPHRGGSFYRFRLFCSFAFTGCPLSSPSVLF